MTLRAEALSLAYNRHTVIHALDLELAGGEFVALVGPNGAGKSALLKGLGRLLKPRAGRVLLDGRDIWSLGPKEAARRIGWLTSETAGPEDLTVRELLQRARFPYHGWLAGSPDDERVIAWVLDACGLAQLAGRSLGAISAGERQRAWVAAALARQPSVLLLDEPTAFLDVEHALEVLELLSALHRERGITILMALHDLIQAGRYPSRVLVLDRGRLVADGSPEQVLRPEVIAPVFGVDLRVLPDPVTGRPLSIPYPRSGAGRLLESSS